MFYRIFFVFISFLIAGCRTSKSGHESTIQKEIFGSWTYKESSGGFTGQGAGWEQPVTLYLNRDFTLQRKQAGQVVETDRFKLTSTTQGEDSVKILDLVDGIDKRYRLSGDSLFLDELVADGFSYLYLRSK